MPRIAPFPDDRIPDVPSGWRSRYVYFLFCEEEKPIVKIGSTLRPLQRFQALRLQESAPLDMRGIAIGSYRHESAFHLHLKDQSVPGRAREWFYPTQEILDFVDRLPSLSDFILTEDCPNLQHPATDYFILLYDAGVSVEKIADFFGRTRQNVYDRLREKYGIQPPPPRPPASRSIEDVYSEVLKNNSIFALAGD